MATVLKLKTRLVKDFKYLNKLGYEVLGVFIYGSQNYNLNDKKSDIDTRAIVIPKFNDLIENKELNKELTLDSGEHLEVKDIRTIVKNWKKQVITSLEIFYAVEAYINPNYEIFWNKLKELSNEIVSYNKLNLLNTLLGMSISNYKGEKETFIKNKNIANVLRLKYFYNSFFKLNKSFKESLRISDKAEKNRILKLKRSLELSSLEKEALKHEIDSYLIDIKMFLNLNTETFKKQINDEVLKYLDLFVETCIKYYIKKELIYDFILG